MRTILFEGATRRWVLGVALLAGLTSVCWSALAPFDRRSRQSRSLPIGSGERDAGIICTATRSSKRSIKMESTYDSRFLGRQRRRSTPRAVGSIAISPDDCRGPSPCALITDIGRYVKQTLLDVIQGGFDRSVVFQSPTSSSRVADEIEEVERDALLSRIIARLADPTRPSRTNSSSMLRVGWCLILTATAECKVPDSQRWSSPLIAGSTELR